MGQMDSDWNVLRSKMIGQRGTGTPLMTRKFGNWELRRLVPNRD